MYEIQYYVTNTYGFLWKYACRDIETFMTTTYHISYTKATTRCVM